MVDVGVGDTGFGTEPGVATSHNFFEALYPWPERITAVSDVPLPNFAREFPTGECVTASGTELPFEDDAFDVAFSNAVVEHVGGRDEQRRFVSELCRVAPRVFLSTPNRWFPVETHTLVPFVHWLPRPAADRAFAALGKDNWERVELLTKDGIARSVPARREAACGRVPDHDQRGGGTGLETASHPLRTRSFPSHLNTLVSWGSQRRGRLPTRSRSSSPSSATEATNRCSRRRSGSARFDVADGKRTERWLLTIDRGDLRVSRRNAAADCVLRLDRRTFERAVNGELNLMAAALRGAFALARRPEVPRAPAATLPATFAAAPPARQPSGTKQ